MGNKNDLVGGTDWVDGEVLYAADLLGTQDKIISLTDKQSAQMARANTAYGGYFRDEDDFDSVVPTGDMSASNTFYWNPHFYGGTAYDIYNSVVDTAKWTGANSEDTTKVSASAGGVSCFLGKQLLTYADGTQKPIEEVKRGDEVLTWNETKDSFQPSIVNEIQIKNHKNLYELHLEDGKILYPTANHPFWIKGKKWATASGLDELDIGADILVEGDYVYSTDKKWIKVEKIIGIDGEFKTYNLIDMEYGTFVVDNIVVHNSGSATVNLRASGSSDTMNLYAQGGDICSVVVAIKCTYTSYTGGSGTGALYITDGSTDISLQGMSNATTYTKYLVVDKAAQLCKVNSSLNSSDATGGVDISTLSGTNWYLKIVATGYHKPTAGATATADFYAMIYNDGATAFDAIDFITSASTTDETSEVGNAYIWDFLNADAEDYTLNVSANGGSNYTAMTNGNSGVIGTTGTSMRVKISLPTTPITGGLIPCFDNMAAITRPK